MEIVDGVEHNDLDLAVGLSDACADREPIEPASEGTRTRRSGASNDLNPLLVSPQFTGGGGLPPLDRITAGHVALA